MINELEEISFKIREHAASLLNDVELAATREEHIRLSARANEAEALSDTIQRLLISELDRQHKSA
jgi:phosphotransferase system HPr-like phosphotransfer protein